MWLYRAMPTISRLGCHAYYRLSVGGAHVPPQGPALLVANHTNSLMDPALVVVAAKRTIRFMAKAPLFTHPLIGWLIKAVGSVPVYRRQDDPRLVAQNFDVFRDVHAAIAAGYAVGIFPEGISHSASRLQPLKTGAARIALGAAALLGRAFPIVPMGLVFHDRRTFRSTARIIIGEGPTWDDLAARGPDEKEAVRELTRRIDQALRQVTLNLHDWKDARLVRIAEEVWRAEFGASEDPRETLARFKLATDALARLRLGEDDSWRVVARELRGHDRLLTRLGFTPVTLQEDVSPGAAAAWVVRQLPLVALLPFATLGFVFFWVPRELTTAIAERAARAEGEDAIPTFRVLTGGLAFGLWFLLLAVAAGLAFGAVTGVIVLVLLPLIAFGALAVGESRQVSWHAMRRYVVRCLHRNRIAALRARQRALAERLAALYERASR
jgi:1-acyl-sn-glycerol-3-phosphate acyltransferase